MNTTKHTKEDNIPTTPSILRIVLVAVNIAENTVQVKNNPIIAVVK